jgi:hypothetical protein
MEQYLDCRSKIWSTSPQLEQMRETASDCISVISVRLTVPIVAMKRESSSLQLTISTDR